MSEFTWDDLSYWSYGEWDVVQERLDDLDKAKIVYNPARRSLFKSLKSCAFADCKVCIVGQDPYPQREYCTGMAFSIPPEVSADKFPITLRTIFKEYKDDLHYEEPTSGDLSPWAKQGVLLWNAYPSCTMGLSLSHKWFEWELLTEEIIEKLSAKGIVFILMGSVARSFKDHIDEGNNIVFETSHPSPRGQMSARDKFCGSRIFTNTNAALVSKGLEPIDWKLP